MASEMSSAQDTVGRSRTHWRRIAGVLCLAGGVGLALLTYFKNRPVEVTLEYHIPVERLRNADELLIAIRTEEGAATISDSVFRCRPERPCQPPLLHAVRLPRGAYRVSASARSPAGDVSWERVVRVEGEGTLHVSFDAR